MLRRSKSNSQIPMPKLDERPQPRSKSITRTSSNANYNARRNVRSGSVERVPLHRQNSAVNMKKSSLATPTFQNVGALGVASSSKIVTPASRRSRLKSPFKYGSARNLNDKKWVSEQFHKVRNFVQRTEQNKLADMLKPPTINTFVAVINLLFKKLDPKVNINMANYKDEVLTKLKGMYYPGNISSSVLKTVNTMHAWPQVISILAWLVDLNLTINPAEPEPMKDVKSEKFKCGRSYISKRYLLYNTAGDEESADLEFKQELEIILGVNTAEVELETEKLKKEIEGLIAKKEKQLETVREIENQNTAVKKQIDDLQLQIETFYVEDEQKNLELDHVNDHLEQRKIRLADAIKSINDSISNLREKLKQQSCTYKEKVDLESHIEARKHTIDLIKENLEAKKECYHVREIKLAEAKKKFEKKIFCINRDLIKLSSIKPELKTLQLSPEGFLSKDFANEIKVIAEQKKIIEDKINHDLKSGKSLICKLKMENDELKLQRETVEKEIQSLNKKERNIDDDIKKIKTSTTSLLKENEIKESKIIEEIKKIRENLPNVQKIQKELNEVLELKHKKEEHLEMTERETLKFFEKLYEHFMGDLEKKYEIRNEIFDFLASCLQNISDQQEEMLNDLHSLDDLKE